MRKLLKISHLLLALVILMYGCSKQDRIQLVKNGKTAYSIYLDISAPKSVKLAAEDLKSYFNKVTGASPAIVSSAQPPSIPFISLGENTATKTAGVSLSGIPIDGFRMVTREGNIYILGPDTPDGQVNPKGGVNKGTSNGVYTFIEDYLGVRWLMPGEIGEEYDNTGTISIPVLDRMEYSPFDYRDITFRDRGDLETQWDRRMKLDKVAAFEHEHNWVETVPSFLFEKHPEWFAMKNGKRVPPIGTYYKLETTNQELVKYFADKIIQTFRNEPDRRWYSLSPSDSWGWSESPESMALTEPDPYGKIAVTPLILTFYNDVARIVGKEFPDHMLGGYIYGNYRYPPSKGLKIEPNLAFMIPNGPCYGFRAYRPDVMENWAKGSIVGKIIEMIYIPEWSELSKKYGFDLYYYDLPITLIQPNGLICPPAPDILNTTFSGMTRYGLKGADIYAMPIWVVSGPGNYAIAKLFWNPNLDAHDILHDYCSAAYGPKGGKYIEELYYVLDTAFSTFYNNDTTAFYSLREDYLEKIYAPCMPVMEQLYLKALAVKKKPRQEERLKLFGDVLSIMNWNLRDHGFIPADYSSPLTLSIEEIDDLLANQNENCRITRKINFKPAKSKVEERPALADAGSQKVPIVPLSAGRSRMQVLLHMPTDNKVSIKFDALNKRAEFLQYILTDAEGNIMQIGAAAQGRTILFDGKAGKNYYFHVPCLSASMKLKIDGASTAYNISSSGISLDGAYMDESLTLYYYVPEGIKSYNITLGGGATTADIFSRDGRNIGRLNTKKDQASFIRVTGNNISEGFNKIVLQKSTGTVTISMDGQLPPWFVPDPAHPLVILQD